MEEELETRDVVQMLQAASQDPELIAMLSPLVAASFGVLPLRREGNELTVAVFQRTNREALNLLEKVLDVRLKPVETQEKVMVSFLSWIYLKDGSVNFNTFLEEDFLKPQNLDRLLNEKEDLIPDAEIRLPKKQVAFLDISLRSRLENYDRPGRTTHFESTEPEIPFKIRDGLPVLYGGRQLSPETALFLLESFHYGGYEEYRHGIFGKEIVALPHLIHPTEIQIAGVRKNGSVAVYLYDHVETVRPGEQKEWTLSYFFLSYGNRLRRTLRLRVNRLLVIPRSEVVCREEPCPFDVGDLSRWLGHDMDGGPQ
jgi:hypothetical protein